MRLLKPILATSLAAVGLALAAVLASAQSSTQSTTLTLTVPTSITLSGLQATYSATLVAGGTTSVFMGNTSTPLDVSTNDSLGYHLTIAAGAANFVGSGTNVIPVSDDLVLFCTSPAGTGCGGSGQTATLSTTAQQIRNTTTSGTDLFAVQNSISIPASQAADSYTGSITLVATAN